LTSRSVTLGLAAYREAFKGTESNEESDEEIKSEMTRVMGSFLGKNPIYAKIWTESLDKDKWRLRFEVREGENGWDRTYIISEGIEVLDFELSWVEKKMTRKRSTGQLVSGLLRWKAWTRMSLEEERA